MNRPRLLATALLLAPPLAGCGERSSPSTVTGLIDATEIDVASKIAGRIASLAVREGDAVHEGQELAVIDSQEVLAKIDQVTASIDAAEAKLLLARKGARSEERDAADRQLSAARHQREVAKKQYDRMSALLASGAIPQAQFDDIESKYQLAEDQLALAEARRRMVLDGPRPEEIAAVEALVRQQRGMLAEVQSARSETVQRAPIAGEVAKLVLHRGELAAPGYPILTLVDRTDTWAAFPVREDLLHGIGAGATIRVEVPALARVVPMKVTSIAPLGDFATWKATTEKASFDLKTFEVRARPTEAVPELRPGMTARWIPGA